MSEKIGGAKGTELNDDFIEMERRIDVLGKLVDDLINKTHEFLQPNPASRAKLASRNAISKMRGTDGRSLYPQPEGNLADHMHKHGTDLGVESVFGACLVEAGESFKHLAEIKYNLEDNVKQNFLEPLHQLQNKDLKEVNHHRKKLSGRRLDFDCKKRKKDKAAGVPEEELRIAEEKFEESKNLAASSMNNVLENEVEYISQLQAFIEAEVDYHRQALNTLQSLLETVEEKRNEAATLPKVARQKFFIRGSESPVSFDGGKVDELDFGNSRNSVNDPFSYQPPAVDKSTSKTPMAKALYDFVAENDGELGFQEGDNIELINQVDENWYEGSRFGQVGFFPINYVEVINPL